MDRHLVAKSTHNVTIRQKVNTAQNLYLGDQQIRGLAAGAAFTQTSTIQRPALLQTCNIDSTDGEGDITNITVAGLSLFVSDQSAALACFASRANSAMAAKQRSIGISISNNQTVVVQGSLVAGGAVAMAIAVSPLKSSEVKAPADQAHGYNFIFGLGTVNVPAGGTANLVATATRPCTLGELILANHSGGAIPDVDLVVESVEVAGLEMLCGATATQQIPFSALTNNSGDIEGLKVSYPIEANAQVRVRVRNFNAAACQVSGGILIEPWK